ncbi:XrtA/PEP-CTERM system-associated ATPase [Novosphingobium sp.]|uniref:XrtA/PEP-CTERM system-associated ATPase n=1 Tax=Novosphingobium sp. TaxID=1874826 RepID=UPI0038B6D58C
MFDTYYNFSARPFQLTPDPDFYFESATHRKALSYLGYGLAQGEGFIVITGEVGAGKSTLAAHLLASIDRERLTAAQIVTSRLDGDELVHLAARAFGINVYGHDKASALGRIESFLHDEARAGRRCLLVVDEAQNLSVEALEELRMLSNFQLGAHPLLQILLLGQPEFRTLLRTSPQLEQLRQRVIATHHLEPMGADEVGPYVEHRLARVGWRGVPSFEVRLYSELARATGGLPRRINQLLNRLLLMGAVEQRARIDVAMLEEVLADLAEDQQSGTGQPAPAPTPAPVVAAEPAPIALEVEPTPLPPVQDAVAQQATDAEPQAVADDNAELARAMAGYSEQIAELQQAVIELAEMRNHAPDPAPEALVDAAADASRAERDAHFAQVMAALGEVTARLDAIEARTADQNEAIRHVLTMLIEWIETENRQSLAA